jgi:predicted transcriptional regulator
VRRGILVIAPFVVLLLAACGSSGGSNSTTQQQQRLTPALYRAQVAKIKREAAQAQSDVSQGLGAKNVSDLKQKIDDFASATQRIGDEVAALNPPQNAAAANAQLAQGLQDIAAGTRAASSKIANLKSVGAAIAYLEHSKGPAKGSREVSKALATLQKLGYTTDAVQP